MVLWKLLEHLEVPTSTGGFVQPGPDRGVGTEPNSRKTFLRRFCQGGEEDKELRDDSRKITKMEQKVVLCFVWGVTVKKLSVKEQETLFFIYQWRGWLCFLTSLIKDKKDMFRITVLSFQNYFSASSENQVQSLTTSWSRPTLTHSALVPLLCKHNCHIYFTFGNGTLDPEYSNSSKTDLSVSPVVFFTWMTVEQVTISPVWKHTHI